MLIYLFALRKYGAQRYGKPLIPAGVLYVPSRSDMERVDPGESPEDIQALRQKKKRRKGPRPRGRRGASGDGARR